ncbi:Peroxisomal membrane protein PER10 [Pleurostoma richardsiae]|uniref:Peroxisomal membrane protein PEX14 n=1 Tax=Pleurostoma richardsiae TaxID=41990 RepID=A0AA38S098_9PEZI|nr:Peroxisomal membrane protein PER10 [Pleurostoma richardsiae]
MPIREDIVASAAQFLQDPSVASAPIENRIAFLQAKNLTQEEVQAALARAGGEPGHATVYSAPPAGQAQTQSQPYYGAYPPYGWQPPPPEIPRRDWRDWFIMATVVGGVGYGLYSFGKRYIYPLVAPPTPERLEQDKKSIDEQFERAFALVEQLSKDTESLKAAEQERTERLDTALADLETVINDLKSANKRREDEAQMIRDDVKTLKDSLPKTLDAQKEMTDRRLVEVNAELKSLKTLISQRMNPASSSGGFNSYLRPSSGNSTPVSGAAGGSGAAGSENADGGKANEEQQPSSSSYQNYVSGLNRSSPFSSGAPASAASIPAWQRAMATKKTEPTTNGTEAGGSAQQEASSSSS